ncbi:MAG: HAMP domain-containing histidine kinase [Bacteroidetes bacterium]|nr:HAMP domain-containing histidine kinase [Bacteroidota bacterium]
MKIKYRLTINFSLLVVGIILIFSFSIYVFYLKHRQEDFLIRLRNKAINSVTLLNTAPFDKKLLKIIDHRSVTNMDDLTVIILDSLKNIEYTNQDLNKISKSIPVFKKLDWDKNSHLTFKKEIFVSFPYSFKNKKFYLLASAGDLYGEAELQQLLIIILLVFISSLALVIIAGFLNAKQSLKPIKDIIAQVDEIEAANLNIMLTTKNNDEIAELAHTFNKMLERINKAFERERFFVSNASHELRTPVTSIKGQVEVALMKKRNEENYIAVLTSILDDVENMTNIINGFLELAETNTDLKNLSLQAIQVDEFLFIVKDEIVKRRPEYIINIEFEKTPDKESEITILGNQGLLFIMMNNLIDNACKFSENKKATIRIDFDNNYTIIQVADNGIGIPNEEIEYIFQPLYRAQNVQRKHGTGIGLSIVQRIAEIHKAQIKISSTLNIGTTISVLFPKK